LASAFKRCPKCGETKPRVDFGVRANGYSRSQCKPCEAAALEEWRQQNPEKARRAADGAAFWVEHGLRQEDYAAMSEAQGGLCAICGGPPKQHRKRLCIDHCHSTKRIRGLLCDHCNHAIGLLNDDPERAEKVARYLRGSDTGLLSKTRRGRRRHIGHGFFGKM
jgi:hypothetical protein